eukprot:TRINITY_DN792_c0_g1_i2.p1 TRINITY_DN792_c0_g1~~TRINITY_DN792_c0_g1_i2.p1  ORF type:complete len:211 (+),score=43.76 TRINITY_DN792_c0_g1_i2:46-678(+)
MEDIKEPLTSVLLPTQLTNPGTGKVLHLLGLGIREVKIALINVRVYAIGFYVDTEAAVKALSSYSSTTGDKLAKDENFYSALANGGVDLAVLISLVRDAGDRFPTMLRESLTPLTKAAGGTTESVEEFIGNLKGKPMVKGTKIFISLAHPAPAAVAIVPAGTEGHLPENTEIHNVDSSALVTAFKKLYLGKNSVSPTMKKSIAERFAAGV